MGYQVLIVRIGMPEVVQKPTKNASGGDVKWVGGKSNVAAVAHGLRWGGGGIQSCLRRQVGSDEAAQ